MKRLKQVFLLLSAFLLTVGRFYAADFDGVSKTLSFQLDKDYDACNFTITTEITGNFKVTLSGKDLIESTTIEDGNTCVIGVNKVKSGEYTVTVTQILEEDSGEREYGEEVGADEIIGTVKISAKATNKATTSVGDVKVARDIAGLKYYLKENFLIVEWSDANIGKVNINVSNASNYQLLDKATVNDGYYEFEIPSDVSELLLSIVPATSANIDSAISKYTISAEYIPNAEVLFEDVKYTNQLTTPVSVTLNGDYSLSVVVNEEEVASTEMLSAGTYDYDIPISEGINEILVYVIDTSGNMKSYPYTVILDSVKPTLILNMDYNGAKTYDESCLIEGTVQDYDSFTVNGIEPDVSISGAFEAQLDLKVGNNELLIVARDEAGNETSYSANIIRLEREKNSIDFNTILIILTVLIALVGGVVVLARKIKARKEEKVDGQSTEE